MIGVYNLLQDGADLPQPCYVSVSQTSQQIDLQFPGKQPSLRAIAQWAHRFGSAVTKHPHHDERGQFTRVTATIRLLRPDRQGLRLHPGRPGQHLADQENPHVRP